MTEEPADASARTIAVDLDGTLIHGDLAIMGSIELVRRSPLNLIRMISWGIRGGRLTLKQQVAARVKLDVRELIWRDDVIDFLRERRRQGRKLVLATAAMHPQASAVADHLGLFSGILCSDEKVNLHSENKAAALDEKFGRGDWEYVGDSPHQDPPVFARAGLAHMIRPRGKMKQSARRIGEVFGDGQQQKTLRFALGLMQPGDWLAKALLAAIVPALFLTLAGPDFAIPALIAPLLQAALAICLAASAAQVITSLGALAAKGKSRLAGARIDAILDLGVARCLRIAAFCLLGTVVLGLTLPAAAFCLLGIYAAGALIISLWLAGGPRPLRIGAPALLNTLCIAIGVAAAGAEQSAALLAASAAVLMLTAGWQDAQHAKGNKESVN